MNLTIGSLLYWTKQYFKNKGLENAVLDAEVLLSHILGKDRMYLYVNMDRLLCHEEIIKFLKFVKKRVLNLPVAYITNCKEFMGLDFFINETVLIPRPDTEILTETAIELLSCYETPAVLDLGTGSGAIIVSTIKKIGLATGVGVDISRSALEVAKYNATKHGVIERISFVYGDLWQPILTKKFDAILSNPPYIINGEIKFLQPEVRNEPLRALAGGLDGLDFYRKIINNAHLFLNKNGFVALEIGCGQAAAIMKIIKQSQFKTAKLINDYSGIQRVIILSQNKNFICKR